MKNNEVLFEGEVPMKARYKCFTLALLVYVVMTPATGAPMLAEPPQTSAAGLIPDRTRFAAGVSIIGSEPKEEFRQNIGNGVGVSGTVQYSLDREGWGNIRFDPSWLRYGNETKRLGGRVELEVTTTHQIIGLSFGPELAVPRGPIRPYINTAFSGLLFLTTSSVRGTDRNDQAIADSTNHSDWTKAWVVGSRPEDSDRWKGFRLCRRCGCPVSQWKRSVVPERGQHPG